MTKAPMIVAMLALASACGRTPAVELPRLLVQVVDEGQDAVPRAEVGLVRADDPTAIPERGRTDALGLATFGYPGDGTYVVEASTDLTCCVRYGIAEVVLHDPHDVVVLRTSTGPCPTWVPPGC
jgi:hypothetical protein